MNITATKIAVFKACATTLLNMDLDPDQAHAAARLFRDGQIGLQLAVLLDGLAASETSMSSSDREHAPVTTVPASTTILPASTIASSPKQKPSTIVTALTLFDDVKRKKINKGQLFSLLNQINESVVRDFPEDISMRESLTLFEREAPIEDWVFLASIIRGASGIDPHLAQLTGRRI